MTTTKFEDSKPHQVNMVFVEYMVQTSFTGTGRRRNRGRLQPDENSRDNVGKWETSRKPNKDRDRLILTSPIFVNTSPKIYLYSKVKRSHLWILTPTTQYTIHVLGTITFLRREMCTSYRSMTAVLFTYLSL